MNKVKCCHNCKWGNAVPSKPRYCNVKDKQVEPDEKCDHYKPKDVLMEFEEGRNE